MGPLCSVNFGRYYQTQNLQSMRQFTQKENVFNMVMVQIREFMPEGNSMNVVKTGNPNIMCVQRLLPTAQVLF